MKKNINKKNTKNALNERDLSKTAGGFEMKDIQNAWSRAKKFARDAKAIMEKREAQLRKFTKKVDAFLGEDHLNA